MRPPPGPGRPCSRPPQAREEARRFRQQARTDPLTGLYNRRFVDEELPALLRDVASGAALVVAIVDADRFKSINDTFSHEIGDQVIQALATYSPRPSPRTPRAQHIADSPPGSAARSSWSSCRAWACAGRCRCWSRCGPGIQRHDWTDLAEELAVSVSIGAVAAAAGDTASAVLSRADRHLYAAKAAGRNRVCC